VESLHHFLARADAVPDDDFQRFRQLVLDDPTLQAPLRQTADQEEFVAEVLRLGRERGFGFSRQDVSDAVNAARRAWIERWI
jgi:hypothetical protein